MYRRATGGPASPQKKSTAKKVTAAVRRAVTSAGSQDTARRKVHTAGDKVTPRRTPGITVNSIDASRTTSGGHATAPKTAPQRPPHKSTAAMHVPRLDIRAHVPFSSPKA